MFYEHNIHCKYFRNIYENDKQSDIYEKII